MQSVTQKKLLKTSFKVQTKIENVYTGGKILVSKDEKKIVCCSADQIKILDYESGSTISTLEGDAEAITAIALSLNGSYIVSASASLQMCLWNVSGSEPVSVRTWRGHTVPVISLCFDSTSTLVASGGSSDHTVKVWDIEKGYCTHNFKGHNGIVNLVMFHPDPHRLQLFSCSDDSSIRVWDLVSKSCVALTNHMSTVTGLGFSSSGWELFSAGRDKIVSVWNLRDNSLKKTVPIFESIEGFAVKSKPAVAKSKGKKESTEEGTMIFTGGEKGVIKAWDVESGNCLYEQTKEHSSSHMISNLIYCPAKNLIVTTTTDHNIISYQADTLVQEKLFVGYNDEIIDVKYIYTETAKEENQINIAVATNSEQVRLYTVSPQGAHECQLLNGHTDIVLCLDVTGRTSSKTPLIATGSKDSTIKIWNAVTRECLHTFVGHTEAVGCIAFAKRSLGFIVSGSKDKTIKLWDLAELHQNGQLKIEGKSRFTERAHEKDINAIAVSPNDKIIASASQDKTIKLWKSADLTLHGTLKGHKRGVWSVEFSPVDQCIVSSSSDKTIRIWSIVDFTCLKTFEGHTNSVLRASFISNGLQLVSCGSDGLIKLWTIKSNECVNTFDQHTEKIWALAVNKNETQFISGAGDSLLNIWEDHTQIEEEQQMKEEEEKILQEQELSNYLRVKDYKRALAIAFALEQPYKALSIFEELLSSSDKEGTQTVEEIVLSLSGDKLNRLLLYIRDWNTNSKHSSVAQNVLRSIVTKIKPSTIEQIPQIKELIEALLPYTERHFQRVDKLLQKSFILDYTLQRMNQAMMVSSNGTDADSDTQSTSKKQKLG